jgi:hypothetical protein
MATIDAPFMGLDLTLQTIPNKPFWPVSYKVGVRSKFSFYFSFLIMNCITRCTASAKNLDGGDATRRCREHTDLLVEELELGILWDEYGLVGDIVVGIFHRFFSSFSSSFFCPSSLPDLFIRP